MSNDLPTKYGVNTFLNEIHIQIVDFDEAFKTPEYLYFVDIKEISNINGNGDAEMKIYTNGELKIFEMGKWKISPIVIMPFNWSGYKDTLEIQDYLGKTIEYKSENQPDRNSQFKKENFILDIEWVFKKIKLLEKIENVEHLELLDHINSNINYMNIWDKKINIDTFSDFASKIEYEINTLNGLNLSDISKSELKMKINESIDLLNEKIIAHV